MSLAPLPPSRSSQSPTLTELPSLNGSATSGPPEIGEGPPRRFPLVYVLLGAFLAIAATAGALFFLTGKSKADRPDLLLHTVKTENLDLTVVERGTLES